MDSYTGSCFPNYIVRDDFVIPTHPSSIVIAIFLRYRVHCILSVDHNRGTARTYSRETFSTSVLVCGKYSAFNVGFAHRTSEKVFCFLFIYSFVFFFLAKNKCAFEVFWFFFFNLIRVILFSIYYKSHYLFDKYFRFYCFMDGIVFRARQYCCRLIGEFKLYGTRTPFAQLILLYFLYGLKYLRDYPHCQ